MPRPRTNSRTGETGLLIQRIAVAVVAVPVLIGILFLGPAVFTSAIALITLLCLIEFYRLFREKKINAILPLGLVGGAGAPAAALIWGITGLFVWMTLFTVAVLLWRIADDAITISAAGVTLTGVFYIGLLLSHLILIYELRDGKIFVLFTFAATWIADTAAYAVGRVAGRRPLAPKISPNKTVEGLAGAVIINLLIFAAIPWMPLPLTARLAFAAVLTLAAIAGDLVESVFKRETGVKDSGSLIPGHGGFLDRFDSMIFTGAAAYYLLLALGVRV